MTIKGIPVTTYNNYLLLFGVGVCLCGRWDRKIAINSFAWDNNASFVWPLCCCVFGQTPSGMAAALWNGHMRSYHICSVDRITHCPPPTSPNHHVQIFIREQIDHTIMHDYYGTSPSIPESLFHSPCPVSTRTNLGNNTYYFQHLILGHVRQLLPFGQFRKRSLLITIIRISLCTRHNKTDAN